MGQRHAFHAVKNCQPIVTELEVSLHDPAMLESLRKLGLGPSCLRVGPVEDTKNRPQNPKSNDRLRTGPQPRLPAIATPTTALRDQVSDQGAGLCLNSVDLAMTFRLCHLSNPPFCHARTVHGHLCPCRLHSEVWECPGSQTRLS
jgi:hypothetical protein